MSSLLHRLRSVCTASHPLPPREHLRVTCGALVGILGTALVSQQALGGFSAAQPIIAPMGASAVLLFAVPQSPLAQPWSILGGNVVAALIGVTAARFVPGLPLAAAVAVSMAIAVMALLRCLHPPGGAIALAAVVSGPSVTTMGYDFVLAPVALNSALLLATALLFNNLSGCRYPAALFAWLDEKRRVGAVDGPLAEAA